MGLILRDSLYGLVIGLTATIPGSSFGTMSMLFGLYEKTIIAMNPRNIKKNLNYLIPFFISFGLGIYIFSMVMTFLIVEFKEITYFCFIGLILGCIPMIYRRAGYEGFRFGNVAIFIAALCFMILLIFLNRGLIEGLHPAAASGASPVLFLWLFFAGILSATATMIPGLSGAVVMLILGAYTVILEAVSSLNFLILGVVCAGLLIGMQIGAGIIAILIERRRQSLYSAVLGLIIGSIGLMYPGFSQDSTGLLSIILAGVSAVCAYLLSSKRKF